ncbi:MAG: AAA family ATPase [Chloroflexi bacterium]|nr:AAA family ATPase [Chloroflexota bacterium]
MAELRVYLFGEPHLEYDAKQIVFARRKALALIAYLVLAEHRQSRDIVATLLWPDLDQQRAHAALRSTLHAIGTALPGDWLYKDRTSLGIQTHSTWIDVTAFLSLIAQSRTHRHDQKMPCKECAHWLKEALLLCHSDFMSGFSLADNADYENWQMLQREWLRRERAYALRRLVSYYGHLEDFETAISYATQWLTMDNLHEPAHQLLMQLYAANGQKAEALQQYEQCVELLDVELATLPSVETDELYQTIQNENAAFFKNNSVAPKRKTGVLPSLPSLIVGRDQALNDFKQRIVRQDDEANKLTIIQGWPGVGKSTLVAALAHDHTIAEHFPDGVLWVSLGEAPSLMSELSVWAEALGLNNSKGESSLEALTAQVKAQLKDRRMLLIVDDIWQIQHFAPFNVGGQYCRLVGTTRLNEIAQGIAPTARDIYRLPVLTETSALELLNRLAPESVAHHSDEARQLVKNLEGLPLAIQVAGRLLNSESRLGWGVGDLLKELSEGAKLLQAPAPGDMAKIGQETSPTIAALLKRSTDLLDPETRHRFALLSLFVPKPATFDLEAIGIAWGDEDARPAIRILVNRGLLEPLSGGRFQMHALLVVHARSLLEEQ